MEPGRARETIDTFEVAAPYRHWTLRLEPPLAWVEMHVDPHAGLHPGYELKLNSYDLGVDLELAAIVQRLRFEHPEVAVVVLASAHERVFCAGANIPMLARASHAWKVNFCKFTNETRCAIEDATRHSGQVYVAACNGTTAGGGYELALACEEIYLQDDGHSAVSLPEVPLLGVLPGTGGLTRLVEKRKVRRDRADVFCTTAEGVRGAKAQAWGLVDAVFPRSTFASRVRARALELASRRPAQATPAGVRLPPLAVEVTSTCRRYRDVTLTWDDARRTGELVVRGPSLADVERLARDEPPDPAAWALRAFRELDDALLHLRMNHPTIGVVTIETHGDPDVVLAHDRALLALRDRPFHREVRLHMARVLRRLDHTSRSCFALVRPGSAFAGCLLELALACDRIYALDDEPAARLGVGACNHGALPMAHGASRLATRLHGVPDALAGERLLTATEAEAAGLVTECLDPLDWDDHVRIAIEERASLSPDALAGLEQNLRLHGPETIASRVFTRLSAWQNWIFARPNATGPDGALTHFGRPQRPRYDWERA